MKKMICEICGSQKIKKVNGVFVCQECGTEYDAESAKRLLKDIFEDNKIINDEKKDKVQLIEENDKYKLLNHLLLWAEYIIKLEQYSNDFDVKQENVDSFYFNDASYYNSTFMKTFFYEHFDLMPLTSESFIDCVKEAIRRKDKNLPLSRKLLYSYTFYKEHEKIDPPVSATEMFKMLKNKYVMKWNSYSLNKGESVFRSLSGDYSGPGIAYWSYFIDNHITINEWVEKICIPNIRKGVNGIIYKRKGVFNPKKVPIIDLNPALMEIKKMYEKIPYTLAPLYVDLFNKECKKIIEDKCNLLIDLINVAPELEKTFMLPFKYRKSHIIIELINLVYEGKAETWKELINLYDTTVYRRESLYKLSMITDEIRKINNNLISINKSLKEIDNALIGIKQSIDTMNDKIQKSNELLRKASRNTFGIMLELL